MDHISGTIVTILVFIDCNNDCIGQCNIIEQRIHPCSPFFFVYRWEGAILLGIRRSKTLLGEKIKTFLLRRTIIVNNLKKVTGS